MSKPVKTYILLFFSTLLFSVSGKAQLSKKTTEVDFFERACAPKKVYKYWSPSRIKYLKENALFPHSNHRDLEHNYKKVEFHENEYKRLDIPSLMPKKLKDAKTALLFAMDLKKRILTLQQNTLNLTLDRFNTLDRCLTSNIDCAAAETLTDTFNNKLEIIRSTQIQDEFELTFNNAYISMDYLHEVLSERIKIQYQNIEHQTDSELFLNDQYLKSIYDSLKISNDLPKRELFCAIKSEMTFNSAEKERILEMTNFYLNAFIIVGVGSTGSYLSITLLKSIKFIHKIVPILALEYKLKKIAKKTLSLINPKY